MKRFVGFGIMLCIACLFIYIVKHSECFGSGGEITLPKTGQTTCYDASGNVTSCTDTGQDGELQKGAAWPSSRFVVGTGAAANCVTDNLTGLMWARNGNIYGGTVNWEGALNYVKTDIGSLCGYNDWRLPNINELKSLVNVGFKEGGFCDGSQCDSLAMWLNNRGFENLEANKYWSSTTYSAASNTAWVTNMAIGTSWGDDKTGLNYVLPVRGGQDGVPDSNYPASIPKTGQTSCYNASGNVITCTGTGQDGALQKGVTWPSPRFEVIYCSDTSICPNPSTECDTPPNQNNDMILDKLTGLYWPRDGSIGGGKTWADALTYANNFTLCGMSGWRLPNLNERVSLMNFGQSNMSAWLNDNNFDVPQSYFWTSSTDTATTTNAWYTAMGGGAISTIAKTNNYYAWPVKTCIMPPDNMISWWKAEDNANDSFGSNHGIAQGGLTYASGKVGKAFSLDAGKYVEIPHKASQNTGSQITVDAWIYLNTMGHGRPIIQKRSAGNVGGFTFETLHGNYGVNNGLQFVIWIGGSIKTAITSTNVLSLNTWHHVAATYDGSNMKIYVDGVEKGSFATTGNIDAVTDSMIVGVNATNSSLAFDGLIDELELYNRALTASEIQSIYIAGSVGKCFTPDTTPDAFEFTEQTNVPLSTEIISNPITVSGINSPTPISIQSCTSTSCSYQVNNGSWVSTPGTVLNGDIVKVRQTSSASYSTNTNLTLNIGGVTGTFSITTIAVSQRTLTVTKAGTGTGTVTGGVNCNLTWSGAGNNTGTCTVNSGTSITLSASAGANSIFTGWSGGTGSASGCTGTDDCIFSLNDDSQVTSFFNDINNIGQVYVNHGSGSVNSVYIGSMNADKDVYIVGPGAGSSQGSYALEYRPWTTLLSSNLIRVNFNGASFTGVPINLCLGSNNSNVGSSNPSAGATNHIFALSNYVANSDFIYFTDSACGSANRNRFPVRLLATNTPKMTTVRVDALTSGGIILDSTLAANLIEITSTAPQLNITKAGSGAGNVTASGCTLNWSGNTATCNVESGGNVTISATADGSSTFVGFTGAGCVGTSNCEVNNITSNKYLTATFRTNGAGNQINLPQTGQSTSYDSNTPKFDDGALRTGQYWPTSRFITNSPTGTVIDKLTGLMWLAAGNTPTIGSCTGGVKTWTDGIDYVTCLNNNNYLDFSDWRLPNVNELASLFHSGQSNSATWLNSQGFSNIPTSSAWYWTSTTNTDATSSAIAIATDNGSFVSDAKTNNNYVIAVRTSSYSPVLSKVARTGQTTSYDATRYGEDGDIQYGEPMPATRFSSSGSIVTDNLTGLKWASTANNPTVGSCTGGAMNWQASANYVSCLNNNNYLGYNDWRVPNKNELRSLIDYQNTAPALPSGYNSHFSGVQNSTYWTSTTVPGATTSAYTVNFSTGLLSNIVKTNNTPYVIPVRGGKVSVVVSVSGSGVVKDSTNTINCGSQCDGSFEFSGDNPIQFSYIPNSGKSLTSVVVNGINIGPVHSLKIRSRTQYLNIQATFSP